MTESGGNPSLAPRHSYGLALLLLLLVVGGFIFLHSDFFLLRTIDVSGYSGLSKEELVDRAGLSRRMNIFQVNLEEFRQRLLLFPEIRRVDLERKLPDTLRLHIVERKPICLIAKNDNLYEVGSDGVIIRKRVNHEGLNLPVLTGLNNSPSGQPPKIGDKRFGDGAKIISVAKRDLCAQVSEIDLVHYRLYTIDSIQVELGNTSRLEEKLSALRLLLSSNDRKKIIGIDVRVPSQPIVLTDKGIANKP